MRERFQYAYRKERVRGEGRELFKREIKREKGGKEDQLRNIIGFVQL